LVTELVELVTELVEFFGKKNGSLTEMEAGLMQGILAKPHHGRIMLF